ncbi:glycosyltransferase [Nesterenkonia flava]|uniref:Glycosyltransferase n=1 Tax=Nesterenkonia flava TaxID=469799 RepID=A0ABU1FU14_9MICC|nr:galactosyltransferase-related protein [Nesterenkonia flava]MDR5711827.1 glycosyltransferase [Nesterenkonia flava]
MSENPDPGSPRSTEPRNTGPQSIRSWDVEAQPDRRPHHPRTIVITTLHRRHDHLQRQREGLARSTRLPDEHVLVAMDDDGVAAAAANTQEQLSSCALSVLPLPRHKNGLPLAQARNLGTRESGHHPDDLLIFLDVDCIPVPELVAGYQEAVQQRPDDLLCGPVAYLPQGTIEDYRTEHLAGLAEPHPARPAPEPGALETGEDYNLFWSLSFALRREVFERIAGFDEAYVGYGAEDTDFAWRARQHEVDLTWVGSARAFHQYHPVSRPPVEHLDDILRNGRRFARTWGTWPMHGWLEEFESQGLIYREGEVRRSSDGDHHTDSRAVDYHRTVRVASVPGSHVYIRHLSPPEGETSSVVRLPDPPARRADTPTGAPWWPPAMLDPEWISADRAPQEDFEIFHVHFGFDAESPQQLQAIVDALDAKNVPLVYTAHDLWNPHHEDTTLHEAQLEALITRASAVITLSPRAAEIIAERWGVQAQVIPHPHVVDLDLIEQYGASPRRRTDEFRLGVHLKSLRQNMATLPVLQAAQKALAEIPGGVLQVNLHHDVYDDDGARHHPELVAWLRDQDQQGRLELHVHDYFSDTELYDYLSSLHASLLPYRFGTHSGWMEACHDLGTPVIAPTVGCYASQGADYVYRWFEREGQAPELDEYTLRQAVRAAACAWGQGLLRDSAEAGEQRRRWRTHQRRQIAHTHEQIYRRLLGRRLND